MSAGRALGGLAVRRQEPDGSPAEGGSGPAVRRQGASTSTSDRPRTIIRGVVPGLDSSSNSDGLGDCLNNGDAGGDKAWLGVLDGGAGSPGSLLSLLSMAFQSIQALLRCDQARESCPRSVLHPARSKNPLCVTTIIPFLQRVRATFIRGNDFKKPGCRVRTEDKIT